MPLVSILMPVYNGEKFLAETIESVLKQSYTHWELIICDDGSTDNTKAVVASFTDSRITFVSNAENLGIVRTRNRLFDLANGDYFAILDSDDLSMPTRIEQQVRYLENNKQCGLCGTWATIIDEKNQPISTFRPPIEHEIISANLLFQSSFLQSSVMIRRTALGNIRYSEDFPVAQDFDLWERLSHITEMHNIPQFLVHYRWFSNNISHTKRSLQINRRDNIIERQMKRFGNATDEQKSTVIAIGNLEEPSNYPDFLRQTKRDLKQLIAQNKSAKIYEKNSFEAVVWYRFIFYCAAKKQYKNALLALFYCKSLKAFFQMVKLVLRKILP